MIAFIVSAVIIIASAAATTTALVSCINTAHTIEKVLTNVMRELQTQVDVDRSIMARLQALEAAVKWLGEQQEAPANRLCLKCDWQFSMQCVTPINYNEMHIPWYMVKQHLQRAFKTSLSEKFEELQTELDEQM